MKKLTLILAVATILLAGCQRDVPVGNKPSGKLVTFVAELGNPLSQPFEGGTRFDTGDFSDIDIPEEFNAFVKLRFICQAWQGETLVETFVAFANIKDGGTPIEITLPEGNYDLLFWADIAQDVVASGNFDLEDVFSGVGVGEAFYSAYFVTGVEAEEIPAVNLKHVSAFTAFGIPFMTGIAFSGALLGEEIAEDYELPVLTLDRCVGRVEFSATNLADFAGNYGIVTLWNITEKSLAFNVATDDVFPDTGDNAHGTGSWWMTIADEPYNWMANTAAGEIAYTYAFAAKDGSTKLDARLELWSGTTYGDNGTAVATRTINNIPVKQNQRSRVMTTLLDASQNQLVVKSKLQTEVGKELAPAVTVEWTEPSNAPLNPNKIILKPTVSAYGYQAITYNFQGTDNTARKVTITDPLIIPETEYTVMLANDTDTLVSTTHTTPTLDRNIVTVLTGGSSATPVDLRNTIRDTRPRKETVYLMPGYYYTTTNTTAISSNLLVVGADPSVVDVTVGGNIRPSGTFDYLKFRNIKIHQLTNGKVIIECQKDVNINLGLLEFENCEIDLGYGTTGTKICIFHVSVPSDNPPFADYTILDKYVVNNCLVYSNGLDGAALILNTAEQGNKLVSPNIQITNSTIVNAPRALIANSHGAAVTGPPAVPAYDDLWSFDWDITVDHCTLYAMNSVHASSQTFTMYPYSANTKFTYTNNVVWFGAANYRLWILGAGPNTPPLYPAFTIGNSYYFTSKTPSLAMFGDSGSGVKNTSFPATVCSIAMMASFTGTPEAFWANPTLDPSTFDFTIIAGGITNVGDPRWN